MTKLLRRWSGTLRGTFDALLAPAVDPRHAFASAYERQRELLALARHALADLATTRDQLEARVRIIQDQLPQLEQQARRALVAKQEDIARLALRRRHVATAELQMLEQHVRGIQQKEQMLGLHEARLATQTEAFEARVKLSAASYSAAEAQARISDAFQGVSAEMSDLSQALEQVERQAEQLQMGAPGIETLVEDDLIEAELAALKQQLQAANARPEGS
jgi:phage shock protein A